jgi:cytochrome c553
MKKIMKWTGIVFGVLIGLAFLAGVALYPSGMKKLTKSYPGIPVETVNIPTGADAVARGRHIATVWACTKCHGENFGGMLLADDPFIGTIPASNLTAGKGGIAKSYTDTDWIRAIRHGVKPDSRVEIFMYSYYATMSDQDLGDLIAFLKQIPPVNSDYPERHFGPILAVAPAVGLFSPAAGLIDHSAARPTDPAEGATIEYGKYLSSICLECHSKNLADKLEGWKPDDFTRAIKTGLLPDGRQLGPAMPLKTFSEMNDTELAALWLYFMDPRP